MEEKDKIIEFLRKEWLKVGLLVIGVGLVFSYGFGKYSDWQHQKAQILPNQQETSDESGTTTQDTIEALKQEIETLKQQLPQEKIIEKPVYIQPQKDNDTILTEYKLATDDVEELGELLLGAVLNSPKQLCPSIIKARTTRENAYFMFIGEVNLLKSKYGKYRNEIQYIDGNLNSWDGLIQMTKDHCLAAGYNIDDIE